MQTFGCKYIINGFHAVFAESMTECKMCLYDVTDGMENVIPHYLSFYFLTKYIKLITF